MAVTHLLPFAWLALAHRVSGAGISREPSPVNPNRSTLPRLILMSYWFALPHTLV